MAYDMKCVDCNKLVSVRDEKEEECFLYRKATGNTGFGEAPFRFWCASCPMPHDALKVAVPARIRVILSFHFGDEPQSVAVTVKLVDLNSTGNTVFEKALTTLFANGVKFLKLWPTDGETYDDPVADAETALACCVHGDEDEDEDEDEDGEEDEDEDEEKEEKETAAPANKKQRTEDASDVRSWSVRDEDVFQNNEDKFIFTDDVPTIHVLAWNTC